MDLLKTPSVQSLLDSDLESVESLQYLDIEELDEVEYALPASDSPTLAEVLSTDEEEQSNKTKETKHEEEPASCSALQVEFLQKVSQQLLQAQDRSSAGAATALSVGTEAKLTVGTAHGHLLSFHEQTLRWVCDSNTDRGAVSCLAYNQDCTRLLAGYARGLICQYESIRGTILRRVTLGGEIWGTLRVTWAGTSGLALDTGGSVWLIKFSRPLGVRSARTSCLFSGARGEVVAMAARDARILALATLSRVIIVAGGRAAGLRLVGPPDTLPVLEWSETDERVLVCGRARMLQWLSLTITGANISLRPIQRVELTASPLWLGWLGGNLAIFDADENLRLWGEDYDKPLDLSHTEPVYASAFFKGHWTDGRVSRAMCTAGVSALGGACVCEGALSLLGRRGIVRVRPRHILERATAFLTSGRYLQALRLLCSIEGTYAKAVANRFIVAISESPEVLSNKQVSDQIVKLCLKYDLSEELWNRLWEECSHEEAFVEALGDAAVRGDLSNAAPSPDCTQALLEKLAEFEPGLVERVIASLPLTSLDPHRASVLTREKGLWRAVGAIAAALGGGGGAMRELSAHVSAACARRAGGRCACAGCALVVAAADALAGRGAAGRALPPHARPSARHDALLALLNDERDGTGGGRSPLRVMVEHDAAAAVRLLEQSARDPPFVGPLGKQNRLRVARALLAFSRELPETEDRVEILEFLTTQLNSGALPTDQEVIIGLRELAAITNCERADRAWFSLLTRTRVQRELLEEQYGAADQRPRVRWRIDAILGKHERALQDFFEISVPSNADIDELFEYLRPLIDNDEDAMKNFEKYLPALVKLRPGAAAGLAGERFADGCAAVLRAVSGDEAVEFGRHLAEAGRLAGDAAAAHLRNLCRRRPDAVRAFLAENVGLVRPEEALAIVREEGPPEAEPQCLEAVGDPGAALDAILRLAAATDDERDAARLAAAGAELCARAAPALPPTAAAELWARLLRGTAAPPAALLLEAAAYLPPEETLRRACAAPRVALALLACAARRRAAWRSAARAGRREVHERLARALAAAARGLAVRGRCVRCGRRLAERAPVRTGHCARAAHAECAGGAEGEGAGAEASCGACGRRAPAETVTLAPRAPRRCEPPPLDFELSLGAPPRPDLEGIV
ncbi:vacuolar protein sorting 8 [Anticarsia gemmatalis]|uniref:vacuolar protein sorting 8 n=1 Tax=Anticarsia gemmatalis TaxID=129554 RepID=UPI003F7666C5